MQSTGTPDSSMYYENMVMIVCTSDAIFDLNAIIAQLVERLSCKQKVIGSYPVNGSNYLWKRSLIIYIKL